MTLVDARTGIVRLLRKVTVPPDLPGALSLAESVIADTTRWSSWPSDPSGAGCTFWDERAAEAAALGEAVERYCGNLVPPGLPRASYRQLRSAGVSAVDPRALALYAPEQYALPGFPFIPFTRDLPVRWVSGRELGTGLPIQVPASLVWVTYFRAAPTAAEPRTNSIIYAGIAAGTSHEAAEWSALLELLERDAVTLSWTSGATIEEIVPPRWLARLARGPEMTFSARFLSFPSLIGYPVVGALVVHEPTGYVSLGTACRSQPHDAALKALAEAFQLHLVVRQLDDPSSVLCRLAARPESPLKPWRVDRRYGLAYRQDRRDVTDLGCHVQLHLDPGVRQILDTAVCPGATLLSDIPARQPSIAAVTARLAEVGIRVVCVDVTTADAGAAGWHVVRLVAPGLYSNAPAAMPFLGGARFAAELARHGHRARVEPLPYG